MYVSIRRLRTPYGSGILRLGVKRLPLFGSSQHNEVGDDRSNLLNFKQDGTPAGRIAAGAELHRPASHGLSIALETRCP